MAKRVFQRFRQVGGVQETAMKRALQIPCLRIGEAASPEWWISDWSPQRYGTPYMTMEVMSAYAVLEMTRTTPGACCA